MSIQAINVRNQFKGKVREIIRGDVVSEVDVETPWGIVTSVITTRSVDELQLQPGSEVVALVKSGKVRFVRSIKEMQSGVDELQRQNQSGLYKQNTTAKVGQMTAAKYQLEGELTSIVKQNNTTKDVFYKFTLKMFDVQEGTIEWQDEKEIRKTSKR